jgi:DNA polymerase I-like protein with 3'-5' exonuclease and polymerase domains
MSVILNEEDVVSGTLSSSDKYWCYNALDCLVTSEVAKVLAPRLASDPLCERTYKFELSCQAPAMTMMLRGVAFDETACAKAIKEWEQIERERTAEACALIGPLWNLTDKRKGKCHDTSNHRWSNGALEVKQHPELADQPDANAVCVVCGVSRVVARAFNPLSSQQCIHLFYTLLKLPTQHSRKGERGVTADDDAIEHLLEMQDKKAITLEEQIDAAARLETRERLCAQRAAIDTNRTILRAIVSVRKAHKQIGFLRSRRSSDGRLRQSVNVGATETGRWSASKDPFREGTNFQNIADRSRNVIIADPGLWLFYADLEQAESKIVAFDAEDGGYIEAHDSGDVHTFVAKMVWPELEWPGTPKGDRAVADRPTSWDKDHSYRDYAKHVQHGGNIGQTPFGMARDAHIPLTKAKEVYERMYGIAFPGVRRRQREIMAEVRETGLLVTPLARKRQFFGRLWEPATQREGMAQTQQSSIADLLNLALWRVYTELDTGCNDHMHHPRPSDPNRVWLLAQVHDAILGLVRPHDIATLRRLKELMTIPILIRGQVCTIAVDIALGQNFRHFDPKKPETVGGIGKWAIEGEKIRLFNTKEDLI